MMGQKTDQSFDMKVDQQRKLFNLKQVKVRRLNTKFQAMCSLAVYLVKEFRS